MAEENNYRNGQISEIIYIARGSSSDYFYWNKGTMAFAYEVGYSKAPSSDQIPKIIDEVKESTWRFIEETRR